MEQFLFTFIFAVRGIFVILLQWRQSYGRNVKFHGKFFFVVKGEIEWLSVNSPDVIEYWKLQLLVNS